jgi:hypothetical protein
MNRIPVSININKVVPAVANLQKKMDRLLREFTSAEAAILREYERVLKKETKKLIQTLPVKTKDGVEIEWHVSGDGNHVHPTFYVRVKDLNSTRYVTQYFYNESEAIQFKKRAELEKNTQKRPMITITGHDKNTVIKINSKKFKLKAI